MRTSSGDPSISNSTGRSFRSALPYFMALMSASSRHRRMSNIAASLKLKGFKNVRTCSLAFWTFARSLMTWNFFLTRDFFRRFEDAHSSELVVATLHQLPRVFAFDVLQMLLKGILERFRHFLGIQVRAAQRLSEDLVDEFHL